MTSGRQCLFCDSHELNREHLWPDWIVKLFPVSKYTGRQSDDFGVERSWKRNTITEKSRIVCEPCNGGWMSQIETLTIPILKPQILGDKSPQTITVLDQCTLAAWATLRSIVFDTYAAPENRYYTREQCAAFKADEYMSPPPNTHIWLAPFTRDRRSALFYTFKQLHVSGDHGVILTTWVIDHIAFQLVAYRGDAERRVHLDRLKASGWDNVAVPIWPSPRTDFIFQARTHLNLKSLETFHKRFGAPAPR